MVADVPIQLSIYQGKILRDIRKDILVTHYDVQIRHSQVHWLDRSNVKENEPLSMHAQVRGGRPSLAASETFDGSGTIFRSAISERGFLLVWNAVRSQRGLACSKLHHVNENTR